MIKEYTYTRPMPAHRFIERSLINLMVDELGAAGWSIFEYDDGGEENTGFNTPTKEEVWEAYLSVDEIRFFVTDGERRGWIYLIGGNREYVISDYSVNLEPVMQKVFLR